MWPTGSDCAGNAMAWFRLAFRPAVIQDLSQVDSAMAQRLFDKTKWIASNVDNLRHELVASDLQSLSKYAVGDWRIFYSIDRTDSLVDIHAIVPRNLLR
jgi:mRNA interferase RelE/StbE